MTEQYTKTMDLLGEGTQFKQEICDMIATSPMFSELSWREHEKLASYMKAYRSPERAVIFREGEKGTFLCLVIKGRIAIIKETSDRSKKKVYAVPAGKIVGEMAIIDGQPRSASAVTQEDCILAMLTKRNFMQLLEDEPQLGVQILLQISRVLSQRLRRTSGLLVDYLDE